MEDAYPESIWITAEIASLSRNSISGHCYIELVDNSEGLQAKARANLWKRTYDSIIPRFENATGTHFQRGLKVQLLAKVEFHVQYGMSLTVWDIDEEFTLGDLAQKRAQVLRQLAQMELLEANKMKELPFPTQRLALISSPTAAGFEDFTHQLESNAFGYDFEWKLFPTTMQGEGARLSLVQSFQAIEAERGYFDAVVLIRGGGSSLDLLVFDELEVAKALTNSSLPVLTGIGHERDDSVCDVVAHMRFKTPTAVANFLVERSMEADAQVFRAMNNIGQQLQWRQQQISIEFQTLLQKTGFVFGQSWKIQQAVFQTFQTRMLQKFNKSVYAVQEKLSVLEAQIFQFNPLSIMQKGYARLSKDGRRLKSAKEISVGDVFFIQLNDGKLRAENKGPE